MSIRLVHPTGNPFARNAALAFSELGFSGEVVTCFAQGRGGNIERAVGTLMPWFQRELGRRAWPAPKGFQVVQRRTREAIRVLLNRTSADRRLGLSPQKLVDWVYRDIDQYAAGLNWSGTQCIYAYEDGAEMTFRRAKELGIKCYYDLPIIYHTESRRIHEEEAQLRPDVASALAARFDDEDKLRRKDVELSLADRIIVPSNNVMRSLSAAAVPRDRVRVIPFGAPTDYFRPSNEKRKTFRALFVGQVGPRKGVHYLLEAWNRLKLPNAELQLVGSNGFPRGWLERNLGSAEYRSSVPHSELGEVYQQADVFVFPSLVEGLALVQLEAMACGVPLITTLNAGGDDLITEGAEGFLVPIRDIEALMEKIVWAYENREGIREMGAAARRRAEVLSWKRYREGLQDLARADF